MNALHSLRRRFPIPRALLLLLVLALYPLPWGLSPSTRRTNA